ncbi:MAG: SipW-dependent-type signal peptide-containing protein [Clostridiales bacterium]|nr:SipW-dependent-type signal peptide-containing protein [Clostridiales bacterium]
MKSTKKRMIFSMLSMALCAVMLIGTTFAWFTDSVTSGINRINAGNLDVELYHSNGVANDEAVTAQTSLFGVDLWEPGVIAYENFKVANVGDLALKYNLKMSIGGYNTVKNTDYNLTQVLKVAIVDGGFSGDRAAASALSFDATLDEFVQGGSLLAGEDSSFGVVIYWQPNDNDIDNLYNLNNGKESSDGSALWVDLGIDLVATQLSYESDSFDNLYDESAVLPAQRISAVVSDLSQPLVIKNGSASAEIPAGALDGQATSNDEIALIVEPVGKTENSATYDISLMNITQDQPIESTSSVVKVTIKADKNLVDVKAYHNGVAMAKATTGADQTYNYDPATGILTIYTSTFSPFKITFVTNKPAFNCEDVDAPTVNVYHFGASIPDNLYDIMNADDARVLNKAVKYSATEEEKANIENSPFKDYQVDYVISFNKDVKCDSLALAGNYGDWGWIGFDIPSFLGGNVISDGKLVAGSQIRLLSTVGINDYTYKTVCKDVVDFTCGAADLDGSNAGTTMTIQLRIYETDGGVETGAYIVVDTLNYTF